MLSINVESDKRKDVPVRYIISLGQDCCTGLNIKRVGLKVASYPFDWTSATYKHVSLLLKQGIKDNYIIDGVSRTFDETGLVFVHHDIKDTTDRAYLERCYARLMFVIKEQKERVLFLRSQQGFGDRDIEGINLCRNTIKELNPELDFDIMSICTKHLPDTPGVHIYRAGENIIHADVAARTHWWADNVHANGDHDIWHVLLFSFNYDLVPNEKHHSSSHIPHEAHFDTPYNKHVYFKNVVDLF